jgi:hypothetical protein
MSKFIETPTKAMQSIRSFVKEVYHQTLHNYRDETGGNMLDKHQVHLVATLAKETSEYIINTSTDQLTAIKNNLLSVISTLPESNTRHDCQLELLFGIGATLFSLYNYINVQTDSAQVSRRNKNSISSLNHIVKIQEDHLKHLEIELAHDRYSYLQNFKFNPALLILATQDITFQTKTILNKFLNTIQQLQVKRLSPDFLQVSKPSKSCSHTYKILPIRVTWIF